MIDNVADLTSRLIRIGTPFGLMLVRIPQLEVIYDQMEPTDYAKAVRRTHDVVVAAIRATDRVGLVGAGKVMIALTYSTRAGLLAASDRLFRVLSGVSVPEPQGRETPMRPEIAVVVVRHPALPDVKGLLDHLWQVGENACFGASRLVVIGITDPPRTAFQRRQRSRCPRGAGDS